MRDKQQEARILKTLFAASAVCLRSDDAPSQASLVSRGDVNAAFHPGISAETGSQQAQGAGEKQQCAAR